MAYVCETLQLVNNVQTCVSWVAYTEPDIFKTIALSGEQARSLYLEFSKFLSVCVCFVLLAKVAKIV